MRRVCCWCGAELGEREPLDNPAVTGTICPTCFGKFRIETACQRAREQGIAWVVLTREHRDLYAYATDQLRDHPHIRVILDRRTNDRRTQPVPPRQPPSEDCRSGTDRRHGRAALLI